MIGERVEFESSCVVPDDPGEVVTHAHATTESDRVRIREQQIARLGYDAAAVAQRERRIAIEQGRVTPIRRWGTR